MPEGTQIPSPMTLRDQQAQDEYFSPWIGWVVLLCLPFVLIGFWIDCWLQRRPPHLRRKP